MIIGARKLFYVSCCLTLFAFSVYRAFIFTPGLLDSLVSRIAYPFLVLEQTCIAPVKNAWLHWHSHKQLEQLLTEYKQKNEQLVAQSIEQQEIKNYDEETKELREFAQRYTQEKAITAQILLKHFDDNAHFYLVDAGSNKGITCDMVVVVKNCLIGRICDVYPYYSKVRLITDKLCKIPAYCSKTGVQGIHQGCNQLDFTELSFVNHLEKVEIDDMVISSGEGIIFPRGFGLGLITACRLDEFHYTITMKPLADLTALRYCLIIQKGVIG